MNDKQVKQAIDAARNQIVFNPKTLAHMNFAMLVHKLEQEGKLAAILAKVKNEESQRLFDFLSAKLLSLFPLINAPTEETLKKVFDAALRMRSASKGKEKEIEQDEPATVINRLNMSLASADAAWSRTKARVEAKKATEGGTNKPKEESNIYVYDLGKKAFTQVSQEDIAKVDLGKKHAVYSKPNEVVYKAPVGVTAVSDEILWDVIKFGVEKLGVKDPLQLKLDGPLKKQAEDLIKRKTETHAHTVKISQDEKPVEKKEQSASFKLPTQPEEPKKDTQSVRANPINPPAMPNTQALGLNGPIPRKDYYAKSDRDELRKRAMSNNQPNRHGLGK